MELMFLLSAISPLALAFVVSRRSEHSGASAS
jgi:hypothetical protein